MRSKYRLLIIILALLLCTGTAACGVSELTADSFTREAAVSSDPGASSEESASDDHKQQGDASAKAAAQDTSADPEDQSGSENQAADGDRASSEGQTVSDDQTSSENNTVPGSTSSSDEQSAYDERPAAARDGASDNKAADENQTLPETEAPAESQTTPETETSVPLWCQYTVDAGGEAGVIYSGTIEFTGTASVYDLLLLTGLDISMKGGNYISSINGLKEKEHGPMSGWLYQVDGVTPMKACTAYYLSGGEVIYWFYQYDD